LSSLQGYIQESFQDQLNNLLLHSRIDKIINSLPSYSHYIKVDIKGFYQSIDHELLFEILKPRLCSTALELIRKAIMTKTVSKEYNSKICEIKIPEKGVPEGLSISNLLADIYLLPIDNYYQKREDMFYCRYVDDIIILCDIEIFEKLKTQIEEQLSILKLEIHSFENENKMGAGLISNGFSYLGYQYYLDRISVRTTTKDRFEHSLEKLFSDYSKEKNNPNYELFVWKLNLKITGCIYDNTRYGWIFFYSQITDLQLLKHLDWLVNRFFSRYKIPKPDGQIKSFFRIYHEIKYCLNTSNYFLNTNRITTDDMIDIIYDVFHYAVPAKEEEIRKLFFSIFNKSIKELEKDIQFFS
jgi:RNA-directed DNA polymerase